MAIQELSIYEVDTVAGAAGPNFTIQGTVNGAATAIDGIINGLGQAFGLPGVANTLTSVVNDAALIINSPFNTLTSILSAAGL